MMSRLADRLWHRLRRYELIQEPEINAGTGTMDFYCTCYWCRRKNSRNQ